MAASLTPAQIAELGESKQHAIVGSLVLFLVIGNISVALRLYSQLCLSKKIFAEDYFILLAAACSDVVISNHLVATTNGLGLHIFQVVADDPYQLVTLFKYQWVNSVFNGPVFVSIKLSLLFFYRRVFIVHQKWLRIFWWINIVYNMLWFIGSTAFFLFQCSPVEFYWTRYYVRFHLHAPYPIEGECRVTSTASVAVPLIFGLVADVALIFFPMVSLSRLHMSMQRKLALLILFSFGILACVLELVRIIIVEVSTDDSTDPTWGIVTFVIVTCCEEMVAIMCACVPLIASLWKWHADKICSSRRYGLSGASNRPIKLAFWKSNSKIANSTPSVERLDNGSAAVVRVSNERAQSLTEVDPTTIRVKTDLEWGSERR